MPNVFDQVIEEREGKKANVFDEALAERKREPSLASRVISLIRSPVTAPARGEPTTLAGRVSGLVRRLYGATKGSGVVPTSREDAEELLNPNAGVRGVPRVLEEEGLGVGQAVRKSGGNIAEWLTTTEKGRAVSKALLPSKLKLLYDLSPKARDYLGALPGTAFSTGIDLVSDSLTPSSMQQNLGMEGLSGASRGAGVLRRASRISKVRADKTTQLVAKAEDFAKRAAEAQPKLDAIGQELAQKYGGSWSGKPKKVQSIINKVERKRADWRTDYDVETMKDHTRGKVELKSWDDAGKLVSDLQGKGFEVEAFIDKPLNKTGYRGINSSVDLGNGIKGEIQVHTPESWAIKKQTDQIYKKWRNVKPEDLPEGKLQEYKADMEASRKLWDDYWGKVPSEAKAAISDSVKGRESMIAPKVIPEASFQTPPSKTFQPVPDSKSSLPSSSRETLNVFSMDPPSTPSISDIPPGVKGQGPGGPTPPAGPGGPGAPGSGLPERDFFGQQLRKFNVSDDAKAVFAETSEAFKGQIDKARRGKIDWKGTEQLAKDLGMEPQDLISRRKGQAFNAEELEAAKGLTGASMERVAAAKKAYQAAPTTQNLLALNAEIARHSAVQQSFLGARAEAGRALQILRKVTDPASQTAEAQQALLDALGGQDMAEEVAKRLAQIDPTDIAAVNKFIRDVTKAKTSDKVYEFFLNSILSSPMTHKANVIGNTLFAAAKLPEKAIRAMIDTGVQPFTGKRTAFAGEVSREAFGLMRGLTDGVRRALHVMRTGVPESAASKLETTNIPAIKGKLGEVVRLPSKALVAEDEFAKAIVGRMELSGQAFKKAKLEGLKGKDLAKRVAELEANPTDDMLAAVKDEELLRTFQTPSGPGIAGLMRLRQSVPGLRYIIPFLKTPSNVAARAIERSPLGWFKVIGDIAKKKGQAQTVTDAANATLGSSIAAGIAYYAAQDKVTATPPKDTAKRDKFFREGKIPYALKIGDKWYSYARFEPLSMVIGGVAQAIQNAKDAGQDPDSNAVGAVVSTIPKYLVSQTWLSGLRDFMDAMDDPERYGNKWVNKQASAAVPFSAFFRFLAQRMDPVVREPRNLKESVMAGLPGLSKQVPPRLNVYGEESTRPNDLFSTALTPRSVDKTGPTEREDEELERSSGFPAKAMAGIKLEPEEYARLLRISGGLIKKGRLNALRNAQYRRLPAQAREQYIGRLESMARLEAKRRVFPMVLKRAKGQERRRLQEYGARTLKMTVAP